jgi:hypothetical protein
MLKKILICLLIIAGLSLFGYILAYSVIYPQKRIVLDRTWVESLKKGEQAGLELLMENFGERHSAHVGIQRGNTLVLGGRFSGRLWRFLTVLVRCSTKKEAIDTRSSLLYIRISLAMANADFT